MATFIDRVVKSETRYEPGPLPENVEDLGNYLVTELKRIGNIFFNQATLHILLNKIINVKVFNNGKIQMTGLKENLLMVIKILISL